MEESVAEVISGGGRGNHESGLLSIEPVLKLQELIFAGVDTVNDPCTGGTTQLSNLGQYHFTDGFGNYRTTDDPNYTPEKAGEVGTWTAMTLAQVSSFFWS